MDNCRKFTSLGDRYTICFKAGQQKERQGKEFRFRTWAKNMTDLVDIEEACSPTDVTIIHNSIGKKKWIK